MVHVEMILAQLCAWSAVNVALAGTFDPHRQLRQAYQSRLQGPWMAPTPGGTGSSSSGPRGRLGPLPPSFRDTLSSYRTRIPDRPKARAFHNPFTTRTGQGQTRGPTAGTPTTIPGHRTWAPRPPFLPYPPAPPAHAAAPLPGSQGQGHGVVCDDDPALVCVEGRYRSADGSCNNLHGHPTWGLAGRPQERLLPPVYQDGSGVPRALGIRGQPLPSPREVSQVLHSADSVHTESSTLSHMFTMWGQFLDHDITHTPMARDTDGSSLDCCNQPRLCPERDLYSMSSHTPQQRENHNPNCLPIRLSPLTDRHFSKDCMNFVRSKPFAPTSTCRSATREQGNTQTSFIDASQLYGPSLGDQQHLRTRLAGKLHSGVNDLLPENSTTMCTINLHEKEFCFGSGDPRVNEHPMLSSIHVVFHRFHNMLASRLARLNTRWNDETLFQETRKIIGAIMQHVTYAEYLPLVLGDCEMARYNLTLHGLDPYVYDPYVNPRILNAFSTAAFRFGHSMVNGLNTYGFSKVNLREMFFHPHFVQHNMGAGLTMLLSGLLSDRSQHGDRFMSRDLTDHMFKSKDGRSLDLASLNVQRGRDHGLPAYDEFRKVCGLPSLRELSQVTRHKFQHVPFLSVYRDLEDVDLFTGGLSEEPLEGGAVGPTFGCIIARQFQSLKYGDRFWYQNTRHPGAFTAAQIRTIESLGLADVLCAATDLTVVQTNPFAEPSMGNPVKVCSALPPIDLSAWKE